MSDAALTVKMALDRLAMKQGLDGASADVDNFKKKFERSLRDTRGAVKDVSGSIEGIGRAFDGSIQGAVGGLRDLLQLIPVSPWAAMAAAAAGAFTAIVKNAEEMYGKLEKAGEDAAKKRAAGRGDVLKAMGIQTEAEKIKSADYREQVSVAADKTREVFNLTDQIDALNKQIQGLEQQVSLFEAIGTSEEGDSIAASVKKLKDELASLETKRAEAAKIANLANEEANKKELAALQNSTEQHNKKIEARLKADAKAKESAKKLEDAGKERVSSMLELFAGANKEAADIFNKERTSIFDKGDIYQRMGGQVGRNLAPELRQADIRQQREKELVELQRKTADALQRIEKRFESVASSIEE